MADKHVLKLTEGEAILKCYTNEATGSTITISLQNDLTRANEVYVPGVSKVTIKSMHWGTKKDKQLDVMRLVSTGPDVTHGHYFLINAGSLEFSGFADNTYATSDVRLVGDGPFHMIIVLGKSGWQNKIETAQYSIYDNINTVGS